MGGELVRISTLCQPEETGKTPVLPLGCSFHLQQGRCAVFGQGTFMGWDHIQICDLVNGLCPSFAVVPKLIYIFYTDHSTLIMVTRQFPVYGCSCR